jgi:Trk-type K+ transport system membrane component
MISIIGGIIIKTCDNDLNFVDALYIAVSGTVNAGLTTISMSQLSKSIFIIIGILMLIGSSTFMLLPTITYRYYRLTILHNDMTLYINNVSSDHKNYKIVQYHLHLKQSLLIVIFIILSYMILLISIGILILYIALYNLPIEPELQQRNITNLQNAIFISISAYSNTGFTLSSNSLYYYNTGGFYNTICLITIGILILSGNIFFPILIRYYIVLIKNTITYIITITNRHNNDNIINHHHPCYSLSQLLHSLDFILDNPRNICTHMFNRHDSIYLFQMGLMTIMLEWFVFILTCTYRPSMLEYGTPSHVIGLGLFQVLNTRHAGFAVFDLRDVPQSMLFIMSLMMILSSVPYIGVLHRSTGILYIRMLVTLII